MRWRNARHFLDSAVAFEDLLYSRWVLLNFFYILFILKLMQIHSAAGFIFDGKHEMNDGDVYDDCIGTCHI